MRLQTEGTNPAVVAALLVILAGAVVATVVQLRPEAGPVVTPVASAEAAAPAPAVQIRAVARASRDPFFHPVLRRAPSPPSDAAQSTSSLPRPAAYPVLPPRAAPWTSGARASRDGESPAGRGPAAPPAPPTGPEAETAEAAPDSWRVTAVIGGTDPVALVEGAGGQPAAVRRGDELAGLRIAAVSPREVVVAGPRGLWTLAVGAGPAASVEERPHASR